MHRLTLNRLRAEIEPVSAAAYMRFLFAWQRVDPDYRVRSDTGLLAVLRALDAVELPASAWDDAVLPARVDGYDPHDLDALCQSGLIGWGRLSAATEDTTDDANRPSLLAADSLCAGRTDTTGNRHKLQLTRASGVALYLADNVDHWRVLNAPGEPALTEAAKAVEAYLTKHGASFAAAIGRACALLPTQLEQALGELVATGRASSDNFSGLRDLVADAQTKAKRARAVNVFDRAGRWSLITRHHEPATELARLAAVEAQARTVLARYGVVAKRTLERETLLAPWRDIVRVLRRMEARGEVRGGYFVTGISGEQYALPEALGLLRRHREPPETAVYVALSAADPLNFTGSIIPGERVPGVASHRILFRNALPVAVYDGRTITKFTGEQLTAETERLLVQTPGKIARSTHTTSALQSR